MLGKLLKYECKSIGRILLPIYALLLVLSVIFGFILRQNSAIPAVQTIRNLLGGFYTMAGFALIAITVGIIILQFYRNLLGNEGYLMFATPVTTGRHITNKMISGTIWTILGVIVGLDSILTLGLISQKVNWNEFTHGLQQIFHHFSNTSHAIVMLQVILVFVVCSAEMVAKIYASIAVGHQWSNHRKLGAVIAYAVFSAVEGIVGVPIIGLTGNLFSSAIYHAMGTQPQWDTTLFTILMVNGAILLAVYWFVSWILLHKRLNLQ